jgi:glutamate synthase domain-containing protein 2
MKNAYLFPHFEVLRDEGKCIRCRICEQQCPHGVHHYETASKQLTAQENLCVNCQRCAAFCPTDAIKIIPARSRFRESRNWSDEALRAIRLQAQTGSMLLGSGGSESMVKDYFSHLSLDAAQLIRSPIDPVREPPSIRTQCGGLLLATPILFAAMSFGSLSLNAHKALASAAKELGTCWNCGEGGLHPQLLGYSNCAIVQIASGRFGLSEELLQQAAAIEIKLGQGGKPGIGGHLPGEKVTAAVAALRRIPIGTDAISPAAHYDIRTEADMKQLIQVLRQLTLNRKPILIKVAAVHRIDAVACAAARCGADILCIDGSSGGTGAAPCDIRDNVGIPLPLGLAAAHTALRREGLREKISIIASGSIRSAADAAKAIALGADACGIGTAALVAMGCRQCRACHSGRCAWGIATQDDALAARLDAQTAADGLTNLITSWNHSLTELLGGLGMASIEELKGNREVLRGIGLNQIELDILGVRHAGQ